MPILQDTNIEEVVLDNKYFLVKREDLACSPPGPPFSKMRGVWEYLNKLKNQGIKTVGYTETSISMAGWGVAWACKRIGLNCIIFDPQYVSNNYRGKEIHEFHRSKWREYNAKIVPIKAGMAKVNYNICKNMLREFENSLLLPLGLPFKETIEQTAKQVVNDSPNVKTIVICVGSGTIAAGVIKGFAKLKKNVTIYGICCRETKAKLRKQNLILEKAGFQTNGLLSPPLIFHLVNLDYDYTDKIEIKVPFPCNPYYDTKALKYLLDNYNILRKPILFWNIGGGGRSE